jgi:hypothetical protein
MAISLPSFSKSYAVSKNTNSTPLRLSFSSFATLSAFESIFSIGFPNTNFHNIFLVASVINVLE